jgi:hypothetical protein
MPIEIKELIIKTTLLDEPDVGGPEKGASYFSEEEKEAMIMECVDTVLKILQRREER